jgi:tRNA dimethylallyltransferase
MLSQGLIDETLSLLKIGYSPTLKPLQSIGYRHALWYLKGLVLQEEMLRLLQRDTRHFAKRQLTWFRRDPRISWYDIETETDVIVGDIVQTCSACQTRVE